MDNQQRWIEVIKKLPVWTSGTISLVTALIGFALLLQGERRLGITILAIVGVAALFIAGAYVAFARTPPLVSGGRGVYRFEKYRPWALVGIGFVLGFVTALLLSEQNRTFVLVAFLGSENPAVTAAQAPTSGRSSASANAPAPAGDLPVTTAPSSSSGAVATGSSGESDCFTQFFSDVPADRIKDAEVGAGTNEPQLLIGPAQPKDEIVALKFTEFNRPLGAMKFNLFPESEIFKIISLVDADCQEIETFSSVSGGDKRVLSRDGGLRIQFGGREYILQLIYDSGGAGEIWLGYFQSSGAP